MKAARRGDPAMILAIAALMAAGCSGPGNGSAKLSPSASVRVAQPTNEELPQTPLQATLAWFAAINRKDKARAVAAFEPEAAPLMDWGNGDPSGWPTFTRISCRSLRATATSAALDCTFKESDAPDAGNPDSFWDVYLRRQPGGGWRIVSYGQG